MTAALWIALALLALWCAVLTWKVCQFESLAEHMVDVCEKIYGVMRLLRERVARIESLTDDGK